jgi:hypothetical protein
VTTPYNIDASFKTNLCSGYLGSYPNYQFAPSLYSNCLAPTKYPGTSTLDDDCYTFVEQLGYCHTPEFHSVRDFNGELQTGYVDNTPNLSSRCKDFLKRTYNYPACLDFSRQRSDFLGKTWYIYLKQKYELWGDRRETITLYDQNNLVVDQININ